MKRAMKFRENPNFYVKKLRKYYDKKTPLLSERYDKMKYRNIDITYDYVTTYKSMAEVGKEYGLTGQSVRGIVYRILRLAIYLK